MVIIFYTKTAISEHLKVSRPTIDTMIKDKKVIEIELRDSKTWYIIAKDLFTYLAQ